MHIPRDRSRSHGESEICHFLFLLWCLMGLLLYVSHGGRPDLLSSSLQAFLGGTKGPKLVFFISAPRVFLVHSPKSVPFHRSSYPWDPPADGSPVLIRAAGALHRFPDRSTFREASPLIRPLGRLPHECPPTLTALLLCKSIGVLTVCNVFGAIVPCLPSSSFLQGGVQRRSTLLLCMEGIGFTVYLFAILH
jgi:hypothetical protein